MKHVIYCKPATSFAPPRNMIGAIAVAFAMIGLASCDVGSVLDQSGGGGDGGPDSGGGGGDGAGGDGSGGSDCVAAATPGPIHVHAAGGTANAGKACIASGCHLAGNLGSGASAFSFAGTLYTTGAATAIVTGATVQVETAAGKLSAVTDLDGNFVFRGTVTFPAMTLVTECPSVTRMNGSLTTGGGNCNNCHRPGGTTTPIFL